MNHYNEADMLELFYLPPAEMIPARKHLSECLECMVRYDGLQKKLQSASSVPASLIAEKPETFWDRQRFSVMRKIQSGAVQPAVPRRWGLQAAAAALVIAISAMLMYQAAAPDAIDPAAPPVVAEEYVQVEQLGAAAEVFRELRTSDDPWSSEELTPFRAAVEWESWATEAGDLAGSEL